MGSNAWPTCSTRPRVLAAAAAHGRACCSPPDAGPFPGIGCVPAAERRLPGLLLLPRELGRQGQVAGGRREAHRRRDDRVSKVLKAASSWPSTTRRASVMGRKSKGRRIAPHNPTPGPAKRGEFLYGHVWVTLAWVVRHPVVGEPSACRCWRFCMSAARISRPTPDLPASGDLPDQVGDGGRVGRVGGEMPEFCGPDAMRWKPMGPTPKPVFCRPRWRPE